MSIHGYLGLSLDIVLTQNTKTKDEQYILGDSNMCQLLKTIACLYSEKIIRNPKNVKTSHYLNTDLKWSVILIHHCAVQKYKLIIMHFASCSWEAHMQSLLKCPRSNQLLGVNHCMGVTPKGQTDSFSLMLLCEPCLNISNAW